jgi:FemAB-related protein (PEP-CTERM system-associated)
MVTPALLPESVTVASRHSAVPAIDSGNGPAELPSALEVASHASPHDWDEYVCRHPAATLDHLWHWRDVFRDVFRHDTVYLSARRGGRIVGVLPLVRFRSRLFGRFVVSLPFLNYGGVLADDEAVAGALVERAVEIAHRFRASHIELRHIGRQCPALPYRQHKLRLARPLPPTPEALWDGLDRKVRNQVRKAQKEGLVATHGGAELLDDFYRVFACNMRDLGTPVYSRRLFEETLRRFPDQARVVLVRKDGRALAGGLCLRFRDTVLVPWASSLRAFRHLCPNMLLYWAMIEAAIESGARTFDFGRSSPGAGTHQFKLQWGAIETPLHWEYVLLSRAKVPDHGPANPRFQAAIEIWRRLPLGVAGRLGPLVARHLG